MNLFKHQKEILLKDPKKSGIFWGTGSGKTITALMLAEGRTLVIAPKTTRDDKTWERNLSKLDNHKVTKLTVISKEEARRDLHMTPGVDTVIIDEAHTVAGVNPSIVYRQRTAYPKTSQVFEATYKYVKRTSPERIYLLTATPIRTPMAVLGLAWLLGIEWKFYDFRDAFYYKLPIHGREIWSPKTTSMVKERLGVAVQKLGVTGRLDDFIDVPEQVYTMKKVGLTVEQTRALARLPVEFPDPLVLVGKKHQVEQGILSGDRFNAQQTFKENKTEAIMDLYEEFGKVLVFAKYIAQVDMLAEKLRKEKIVVYTLTGQTKERLELMKEAESLSRCVVIAQSSISAGYELPSFRCTMYASESYSVVDAVQSQGRTLRINNPQKNLYVYLVAGEVDEAVRKAIDNKEDFNEKMYAEKRS